VALCTAVVSALALCSCGDTLQVRPIPHNILEGLVAAPFPVYWLGGSFEGLAVTEASHDPSGAYTVRYGNCVRGGEGACVTPLQIVTSPDNSFLPGGSTPTRRTRIRGADAVLARAGQTIVLPTAGVVVDIYAMSEHTAAAAARTAVPINEPGAPEATLPAALPNTGYGQTPLPSQIPVPLRPVG
jgi:hypothetical protein